ncbi:hypothetical protein ACE193_17990 [Bernardetia sp. OM2101]|uniref:hypothetical protein n=1 Tax=Bernardetia sp. OM2101 TaxID=3344876 RepID=UPI0035CF0D35
MNLFSLGTLFFPFLLIFIVFNFIYGILKDKLSSFVLLVLALLSFYKAFEAGLALKNTEIYFVQNGSGQYANYTEHQKYIKIKELEEKQKSRKVNFITFSILYWISSFGVISITLKILRKHRKDKKKINFSSNYHK